MPLKISFNLRDCDLQHFEEVTQQAQALARQRSEEDIIAAAVEVLMSSAKAQLPAFLKDRFARLDAMLDMIVDADWQARAEDRQRVINALACFGSTAGRGAGAAQLPASVGFLDHAIMIELVSRDLVHDLQAYRDFCKFRETQLLERRRRGLDVDADRDPWLQRRREELQTRMHARRRRELDRAGSSVRKLFSLFGL